MSRCSNCALARATVNALNPELCRDLTQALDAAWPRARKASCGGRAKVFSAGWTCYLLSLGDDHAAPATRGLDRFSRPRAPVACPVRWRRRSRARAGRRLRAGAVLRLQGDGGRPVRIGLNEPRLAWSHREGPGAAGARGRAASDRNACCGRCAGRSREAAAHRGPGTNSPGSMQSPSGPGVGTNCCCSARAGTGKPAPSRRDPMPRTARNASTGPLRGRLDASGYAGGLRAMLARIGK